MNTLAGSLIVKLRLTPDGAREKTVQLHAWHGVQHEDCAGLLDGFFSSNPRVDRRECFAQWVVNEWIDIPRI